MPISLGTNIDNQKERRYLDSAVGTLVSASERLSSGQRINKASDDAAGLSVVVALKNSKSVYSQAIKNLNDGVSLLQITDGALASLAEIDVRLAELSNQAANGVYSNAQRTPLHNEAVALVAEYQRIIDSTAFNGQRIFHQLPDGIRIQAGFGTAESTVLSFGTVGTAAVGTGTFGVIQTTSNGAQNGGYRLQSLPPYDTQRVMVTGDLNADGRDEIVVSLRDDDGGSDHVYSIGFDTSGNALAGVALPTISGSGTGISLADIDGDSDLDVVQGTINSTFRVYLNDGSGTFSTVVSTGTAAAVGSITTGFFNGDSVLDVAVGMNNNSVRVYHGTGAGTYTAGFSFTIGALADHITSGDFTGDGIDDLVVGTGSSVRRFTGVGDGTFGAGATIFTGNARNEFFAARVDGNNSLDLVLSDWGNNRTVIYTNNGSGT